MPFGGVGPPPFSGGGVPDAGLRRTSATSRLRGDHLSRRSALDCGGRGPRPAALRLPVFERRTETVGADTFQERAGMGTCHAPRLRPMISLV